MQPLLLEPIDRLFFRDGRPMQAALSGHGDRWPAPHTFHSALLAALHRAPDRVQAALRHDRIRTDNRTTDPFEDLRTVGPFPVCGDRWYLPRPADAGKAGSLQVTHFPLSLDSGASNLPLPLYPVAAAIRLSKENEQSLEPWIGRDAYANCYLAQNGAAHDPSDLLRPADLYDVESSLGIGRDDILHVAGYGTAEGRIYTARSLRLREGVRLGVLAGFARTNAPDLASLFADETPLLLGGEQRPCVVSTAGTSSQQRPLPLGRRSFLADASVCRVKWVLLTPAIWTEKLAVKGKRVSHIGGWLPNWIEAGTGNVLLKAGNTERGDGERREVWRSRVERLPMVQARLVAALVPKPTVVTGWSIRGERAGADEPSGARPTRLAASAGSVYYFETRDTDDGPTAADHARDLANALNWHGASDDGTECRSRSDIFGEKGFGLGVCAPWTLHPASRR